ncbi:MAG: pilus assembly protein N-terminal domain-containing protein [Gemmataceae bacterium]
MHRAKSVLTWGACGLIGLGLVVRAAAQQPQPESVPMPVPAAAPTKAGNALVVAINGTKRLSMNSKRPIRFVNNEKETVARVQALQDDPTAVLVVGLQAGSTTVRLTDDQGTIETVEVVVQFDIDVVKAVLKRAFPTAQVEPVPAGTNTIVLVGNVQHAEEIEAILRVAQGVLVSGVPSGAQGTGTGGTTVIVNALTVGGVRQVQLDVVMASVNRTEARNLGVNFVVNGTTVYAGSLIGNLATPGAASAGGGGGGTTILGTQNFLQSLTPGNATNIVAGIVPARLNTFIQALRQEQIAKFLAEPRLVTLSGRPATFLSGGQQAVPEVVGGGATGVVGTRFEPFGTQLTFLPIVLGNGKIYLEVEPSVSVLDAANGFTANGVFVPGRAEQRVRTAVTMEPGQTFAVGGLIQNQVFGSTNKTPVIGDLPFIGPAFSTIAYREVETELVILVTPYLVDPQDCAQAPCKLPGTETRSPDDFELFLELILEAPRGQRQVCKDGKYIPAYMNDPTYGKFPCGGSQCANGACGAAQPTGCTTCGTPGAGIVPVSSSAPTGPEPAAVPAGLPVSLKMPSASAARANGKP